jgi:hypothetical protein
MGGLWYLWCADRKSNIQQLVGNCIQVQYAAANSLRNCIDLGQLQADHSPILIRSLPWMGSRHPFLECRVFHVTGSSIVGLLG